MKISLIMYWKLVLLSNKGKLTMLPISDSCILIGCVVRLLCVVALYSHLLQGYLTLSWTDSICIIRLLCVVALYSHLLQGYLSFPWTDLICVVALYSRGLVDKNNLTKDITKDIRKARKEYWQKWIKIYIETDKINYEEEYEGSAH